MRPVGLGWEFLHSPSSLKAPSVDVIFPNVWYARSPTRRRARRSAVHLGPGARPRDPRGVRYSLAGILTLAVCAVLAGAKSFAAIGEFAADLDGDQLGRLGLGKAPVESTMRKLFARLDAAALDAALAVFAWCRVRQICGPNGVRRVIAIDGKTVRGARSTTLRRRI